MKKLIEALSKNYSEDEKNFDFKVSARIAAAAELNQPLSLDEAYKDLESKSKSLQDLRLKKVKEFINDEKNCAGQGFPPSLNLLAPVAEMPNNPIILHYLMQSLWEFDFDPIQLMIVEALKLAVKNQHLSNVKVILEEFKRKYFFAVSHGKTKHSDRSFEKLFAHDFFPSCLHGTSFDVCAAENHHLSLLTASPLIDIVMLFYKSGNSFLDRELLFATAENKRYDIKTNSVLNRNLIALNIYRFPSSVDPVNQLNSDRMVSLLSEFSGPEKMVMQVYGKFQDFLLKADVEKLKSLKYLSAYIQRCCHSNIFHLGLGDELKKSEYLGNLVTLDDALALEQKYAENPDYLEEALGFYPEMLNRVSAIITKEQVLLPVIIPLILQYFESTIFEKIQASIKIYCSKKNQYLKQKHCKIYYYPVIRQLPTDRNSSGMWSLFNVCDFLSTLSIFPSYRVDKRQNPQFYQFRRALMPYFDNQTDDLTALTLILEKIGDGEVPEIKEMFPSLQKNLQDMQEAGEMSAYTILDILEDDGDQKDICLTACREMQTAINFYKLSMRKKNREMTLHCVLIRTTDHWFVEFLALAYSKKNTLYFIQMDCSDCPEDLLQTERLRLLKIVRSGTACARTVAKRVIPVINEEMSELREVQLALGLNPIKNQTAYRYCSLIANFFSIFGSKDFAKLYLPVLSLAHSLASHQAKNNSQFLPLSENLTTLWISSQQTQSPGTSHLCTDVSPAQLSRFG